MGIKTSSSSSSCGTPPTAQYGDKVYLYNDQMDNVMSPVFTVTDTPIIIKAYNIERDDVHIKLEYVFNAECNEDNRAPYMVSCGCQAELNACYTRLFLFEPGQYQFTFEGPMFGVVVTYQEAPLLKSMGDSVSYLNGCCTSCCDQDYVSIVDGPPTFAPDKDKCQIPVAIDILTGCRYFFVVDLMSITQAETDKLTIPSVDLDGDVHYIYDPETGAPLGAWIEVCKFSTCDLPVGDMLATEFNTFLAACVAGEDVSLSIGKLKDILGLDTLVPIFIGDEGIEIIETPPTDDAPGTVVISLDTCELEYIGVAPGSARLLACLDGRSVLVDTPTIDLPPFPDDVGIVAGEGIDVTVADLGTITEYTIDMNACKLPVVARNAAMTSVVCDGNGVTERIPILSASTGGGVIVDPDTGKISLDACDIPYVTPAPTGSTFVACDGAGNTIRTDVVTEADIPDILAYASATYLGSQSVPANQYTRVAFSNITEDGLGNQLATNGTFTCRIAGWYVVTGVVNARTFHDGSTFGVVLYKNNGANQFFLYDTNSPKNSNDLSLPVAFQGRLNVGETIDLRVRVEQPGITLSYGYWNISRSR